MILSNTSTFCSKSSGHDDESDELRTNFMETIVNFIERSDSDVLSFPPSLTGNERKIVHEVKSHCIYRSKILHT